jgi:hypothetical protein
MVESYFASLADVLKFKDSNNVTEAFMNTNTSVNMYNTSQNN